MMKNRQAHYDTARIGINGRNIEAETDDYAKVRKNGAGHKSKI